VSKPSGRERVADFLDNFYAVEGGPPHHYKSLGDAIASDLDALEAAREAEGPVRDYLKHEYVRDMYDSAETYKVTDVSLTIGDLRRLLDALGGGPPATNS
jgi:hypothetical protein